MRDSEDYSTISSSSQLSPIPISMQEVGDSLFSRADILHPSHSHPAQHAGYVLEWLPVLHSERSRTEQVLLLLRSRQHTIPIA